MKTKLFIFSLLMLFASSCKVRERIIETEKEVVKIEYKTNTLKDSIYIQDSVFVTQKGDTILMNKYKYIYKDKLRTDTVLRVDTLRSVETKIQEVNILTPSQKFKNKYFYLIVSGLGLSLVWIFRKQILKLIRLLIR